MTDEEAMQQGFEDRLKVAFLPALAGIAARVAPMVARATPALARVGRAVVGGGMNVANAAGLGQQATSLVRKGIQSSPNFMRNVGLGTAAAGAAGAGALGAGYLAGKAT